jgi:hypothetical protein
VSYKHGLALSSAAYIYAADLPVVVDLTVEETESKVAKIVKMYLSTLGLKIEDGSPIEVSFQQRVDPWMEACFGREISNDRLERGDRLLEEVLELLQSGDYPLSESGLKTAMRRAVPDAGVANFRFHDTRHTAATRILRKSNLRVAQILLGHSDIKTTTKYAHAVDDDIRAAMNAASPTKNPTKVEEEGDKSLTTKKKAD